MSPKDRVKANLYKQLLEEEKVKNKRYMKASVSLFFIGIISTTSYNSFIKQEISQKMANDGIMVISKNVDKQEKEKIELDSFFSKEIFSEKNTELDTEQVFGYDHQI
ncbi:MAG: hypothetical protein KBE73_04810 [Fusobacteriaceae bacterium]|jgi:hypothetical protein|nr:hypothetical protein [Fusobacteriaceae bacterium]MBP6322926.1 hypothetical protein [Fusobacteriaceae bacterium]MBP9510441.1 hypothetical protein [Fusobacteriaceae bacterium]